MLTKLKLNSSIDGWQRQQSAASAPAHLVSELLAYQDQIVRAMAQGTPWAGGRMPLSFRSSPYQVRVGESRFFAPSALDCLRLPALLGETIEVDAICPSSGRTICLIITEQGVASHDPPGCVVSLPGRSFDDSGDPQSESGGLTHFFSSLEVASLWLVAYPGVDILGLDQAWRLVNDAALNDERTSPAGDR